MKNELSVILN